MKKILFITFLTLVQIGFAQKKGTVKGTITDKEMNNEFLPFASVFIKNTSIGTTTDMSGTYSLTVPAGNHILVFSFVGYKTEEKPITVIAKKTIIVNQLLSAKEGVALDEIKLVSRKNREKESVLLLEQRKAVVIVESIGAQRLAKTGVTNAAGATTKIVGVTKSESSGDIYIRGLGDRYLSTTMNGLTIPSDDVENKNIHLGLFSTSSIKSVGISKTYSPPSYADQTSGNVNINTKEYNKKRFSIGISSGSNANIVSLDNTFRRTVISDNASFGFHKKEYALVDLILKQGWDTKKVSTPINFGISLTGERKFSVLDKQINLFVTASHSNSFSYQKGIFKSYRSNILDNSFTDTEKFVSNATTTAYVNVGIQLNNSHRIKYNTLFVNKGIDNLYEQGRNGEGYVFDQDPQENGAFIRDQNYKQTTLFINQLMGSHKLNDNNTLSWAGGYNFVLAEEPNRIRNEVNILNATTVQYAHVGDFQQRKSSQKIEDQEFTAFIKNNWKFGALDTNNQKPYKVTYGGSFRTKARTFKSVFVGVRSRNFTTTSVDNLSDTFTVAGFNSGLFLKERTADRYNADLTIMAGFIDFNFNFKDKLSGAIGFRYETDVIHIGWNVANYVGRIGALDKTYNAVYPSVNLKYQLNDKNFLRFASSITQTLPEFKELAPFEYVSPTGRVTKGNPNLEKSDVYNIDIKWELFLSKTELFSATTFYKNIKNPINLGQTRGSSGNFIYSNTGKEATIYGVELEARSHLIKNEDEKSILNFTANVTKMWLQQDLKENFQYKGKTNSNLQGASDFIFNSSLSYNNQKEKEFIATITANYSSDKIYALGSPEDFANSFTLYNDEIIEKGFVSLDVIMSKKINKNLQLKLIGKNLLNPSVEQTQQIKNLNSGIESNQTVSAYKKGSLLSIQLKYSF